MTGQIVHHDEFGRTWPEDSSTTREQHPAECQEA